MIIRGVLLFTAGIILSALFLGKHPAIIDHPPATVREACTQLVEPAWCDAAETLRGLNEIQRPLETITPRPRLVEAPDAISNSISQSPTNPGASRYAVPAIPVS